MRGLCPQCQEENELSPAVGGTRVRCSGCGLFSPAAAVRGWDERPPQAGPLKKLDDADKPQRTLRKRRYRRRH